MSDENGITRRSTLLGATILGVSSAAALPMALAPSAANAQPNTSSTFRPASVKEQLLYQRAFEAVLWAMPAADTLVMRRAQRERGMKEGAVFYFENRPTGKTEVITFNNETPYVFYAHDAERTAGVRRSSGSRKGQILRLDLRLVVFSNGRRRAGGRGRGQRWKISRAAAGL